MADNEFDFYKASRRALFGKSDPKAIPGHGRSAAEVAKKHSKVKVTLNFDGDVLDYFKERAKNEGRSYQVLINDALREHIRGSSAEQLAKMVGEIILNDPSFYQRINENKQTSKK